MLVFTTHWSGAFGGFGVGLVDRNLSWGIMRLLGYGTMFVYVFFMLSGALISLKVFRGKPYSWFQETVQRYLRLTIPLFALAVLVILFERLGLLWNQRAVPYAPGTLLANFYVTPTPLYKMITAPFVTTIFQGDTSFYGPLWMMPYIFFGTFFSIILSEVIRGLRRRGQLVLYALIGAAFLLMGGYYFCFYLGNLLAFGLVQLEKAQENGRTPRIPLLCLGAVLLAAGLEIAFDAFNLAAKDLFHNWILVFWDATFWISLGGALASAGFILLWEILLSGRRCWLMRLLVWTGERSYSVFLTHWLAICSFSSWFYLQFYTGSPKVSIALNFIFTTCLILLASHALYELIEKRATGLVQKIVRFL